MFKKSNTQQKLVVLIHVIIQRNRSRNCIYANTLVVVSCLKTDPKYEKLRQDEQFAEILSQIEQKLQEAQLQVMKHLLIDQWGFLHMYIK